MGWLAKTPLRRKHFRLTHQPHQVCARVSTPPCPRCNPPPESCLASISTFSLSFKTRSTTYSTCLTESTRSHDPDRLLSFPESEPPDTVERSRPSPRCVIVSREEAEDEGGHSGRGKKVEC